jgi:hypothetical protein
MEGIGMQHRHKELKLKRVAMSMKQEGIQEDHQADSDWRL